MKTTAQGRMSTAITAAIVALVVLSGCQAFKVSYVGTTATRQENITLEAGGPHEGHWEDSSIIVNYRYNDQPDGFEFNGDVSLATRLDNTFRTVNNFWVRANLLDENKVILKSVPIIIASAQPIRLWRFSHYFQLPPDTRYLNFSYSGRAMEGGSVGPGGDGTDMFFWRVP